MSLSLEKMPNLQKPGMVEYIAIWGDENSFTFLSSSRVFLSGLQTNILEFQILSSWVTFLVFLLVTLRGLWDLSSPTRN